MKVFESRDFGFAFEVFSVLCTSTLVKLVLGLSGASGLVLQRTTDMLMSAGVEAGEFCLLLRRFEKLAVPF